MNVLEAIQVSQKIYSSQSHLSGEKELIHHNLQKTTYIKLIIPNGNFLYRAISWWLTGKKDFHGLIRIKLVKFMESSSPCKKYANN